MNLVLRLPNDLKEKLDAAAQREGVTPDTLVISALREHLAEMEDIIIAEERLADLEAGRSKTVPLEELVAIYGVED
ncbi:CopG family transcriptional regulator [Rhizobium sp. G21]|uniref:type II toxin-antitoxin system RelB family antitoxin n=1 Tax=Rhizobium sp. G21 TaxID=2758439 RepID=UPI001601B3B1|nr:CopG family transcriptional regulator [Rhizobium sp. G21]MBB1248150.1 CopG family transcriptional regulator [Rhizobium sp. G21]